MTPSHSKPVFALFVALSVGLGINMLMLQPAGGRVASGRGQPDQRAAIKPAARVMAMAVETWGAKQPAAAAADLGRVGDGPDTIRAVQRELEARGYQPGGEDGVPGLVTRAAVLAYEHDNNLPLTAEPSEALLKHLLLGETQGAVKARGDETPGPQAEQVIRTVQQSLAKAGYAVGKVDGRVGEETVRAIREFETDQNLRETGRISGQLMARLGTLAGQGRLSAAGTAR